MTDATMPIPPEAGSPPSDGSYLLPVVHLHVPARAVEWGFWGALTGATAFGAIDPPLALLVAVGVIVAGHRRR